MKYRTDLAIERKEMIDEEGTEPRQIEGMMVEKIQYGGDVTATRIRIVDEQGARKMGKPIGDYVTIEAEGIMEEKEGVKEAAEKAVAEELKQMIQFHYHLKTLVVGLGNRMVTPDSLGPAAAEKVKITRHLFLLFDADGDDEMANVSCISPGVFAATGMESADIVKKAVELAEPEVVIVIDALAARNIERVSTTIQISDTGISPGAGMGNNRMGINEDSIGVKVIAIGVPTVIDVTTIIWDSLAKHIESAEVMEQYIEKYDKQMIVTSTDIDMIIKEFSDVIANGINKTLHPGIYC